MDRIQTGAERLRDTPGLVDAARVGLVTNYTGVTAELETTAAALSRSDLKLCALFGPEHGLRGSTQAGHSESLTVDPDTGLPVYDTYLLSGPALDERLRSSGVEVLLYDLRDIGTRFYTYIWTMYDLLASAARTGVAVVILDRPNPLGGVAVEGPRLDENFASFVGRAPIPVRHGLTVGELARHLNATAITSEVGHPAELSVIEVHGWSRHRYADQLDYPWVMPSVNIPTLDSATVYPGTGLFEGTNLSEGRGTTRPFELIGAPYIDANWLAALRDHALPGVAFRDVSFSPTFHKYAGETLRGVQLHITDRGAFAPVRTALVMLHTLRSLYPREFGWRVAEEGVERTSHRHFIDLLWGGDMLRHHLDQGTDPLRLLDSAPTTHEWVHKGTLLYD